MASIFTKIINKEIPALIVAEDNNFVAFLDINPVAKGHTLVVPKKEVDYLFDLDDNILSEMTIFAKKIAKSLDKSFDCKRVGLLVVGTEVPHAHIHLIPFVSESQMSLAAPKLKFSQDEMKKIQQIIINNI